MTDRERDISRRNRRNEQWHLNVVIHPGTMMRSADEGSGCDLITNQLLVCETAGKGVSCLRTFTDTGTSFLFSLTAVHTYRYRDDNGILAVSEETRRKRGQQTAWIKQLRASTLFRSVLLRVKLNHSLPPNFK